jgi:hypothetical protein
MRSFGPLATARRAPLRYAMQRSNSGSNRVAMRGSRTVQCTQEHSYLLQNADLHLFEYVFQLSVQVARPAALERSRVPGSGLDRQIRRRGLARANSTC